MRRNKKGISPLIATVLIIGFTIVIAALVITWGTNLFKKTQQQTGELSDVNLACTEVLGSMDINANVDPNAPGTLTLTVDNGANREVGGFTLRVYNADQTSAETIDSSDATKVTSPDGTDVLAASGLKTFTVTYDSSLVAEVGKVGVRPKVNVKGKLEPCQGESEREL